MFKNILIALLAIGLVSFAWLAWRNSQPLTCNMLDRMSNGNMICLINLGNVTEDDANNVLNELRHEPWQLQESNGNY